MVMNRANTCEEMAPLIDLCKKGRLFEVQEWIVQGKPLNLPLRILPRERRKYPLQIAIDLGFYSLVQVLVEGGASLEEPRYSALRHALEKRSLDLVHLLVKNGAKIHSVDMDLVFDTWDKEIIRFFIENGADCETGQPLANAFCSRIRPALAIYMQYKDKFHHFWEQINMALRYHCREGHLKWVALLLWAGADPYTKGPISSDDDPEEYMSALEWAAFYDHFEVFKLKKIHLDPQMQGASDLLENACRAHKADLLQKLLSIGFSPKNLDDSGTSLIQSLINRMSWVVYNSYIYSRKETNIDTPYSREKMKMIHLLVRYGARWEPVDKWHFTDARKTFLKMDPDYLMEFVWIMSEYKACTVEAIDTFMKPPKMRSLIERHRHRYDGIMRSFYTLGCQAPSGD